MNERTIVARQPRCRNTYCPGQRDADENRDGYCDPCYQAIRRRIRQKQYTEEELIERGKLSEAPIDRWLKD
jgi:hypothetical protein